MAIEFNTREFQFSHGKQPRGVGHWAFFFSREDMKRSENAMWVRGSYAFAKKAAKQFAKAKGVDEVFVGS